MSFRAQNELWRAQNRRKTFPKELWASDLEALEVSETPRGDQEGLKEDCKSAKITIYGVCRVSKSRQGVAGSPQRAPRSFLRAKMMFKVPQESSTEALKSSENDLKMKNVDIHKTM